MLIPTPLTAPLLKTSLPGPKAAEVIARDERLLSPSYTRGYPLVAERGLGAVIEDVDGNRFLDFTAGIAVCSTGHCHPRIVAAIEEQSHKLLHMSGTDFYYRPQSDLAEHLARLAPGGEGERRIFFTNSGAEAVEAAFKLARYHTGRRHMIAFFGAFHGRTMGALSLTGSKVVQRRGFAPLVPEVSHIDFPNPYRYHGSLEECCAHTLDQLQDLFKRKVPADEVAGIIVEPIQGEGGYVVPPPGFHRELKAIAEKHGILLIMDEVQAGMGRTGRMFASEHFGVAPDIVCLAKGIASGLPLGAIIARADIMDWPPGSHASTFGGNPVACVAAIETIKLLEEGLMAHAAEVGDYLQTKLKELAARQPLIGDVRGRGLMVGAELVRNRETKEPAAAERDAVVQACFDRGLLMLGCGVSTLRFCPPLVVSQGEIDTGVAILAESLAASN